MEEKLTWSSVGCPYPCQNRIGTIVSRAHDANGTIRKAKIRGSTGVVKTYAVDAKGDLVGDPLPE